MTFKDASADAKRREVLEGRKVRLEVVTGDTENKADMTLKIDKIVHMIKSSRLLC